MVKFISDKYEDQNDMQKKNDLVFVMNASFEASVKIKGMLSSCANLKQDNVFKKYTASDLFEVYPFRVFTFAYKNKNLEFLGVDEGRGSLKRTKELRAYEKGEKDKVNKTGFLLRDFRSNER